MNKDRAPEDADWAALDAQVIRAALTVSGDADRARAWFSATPLPAPRAHGAAARARGAPRGRAALRGVAASRMDRLTPTR
jgi:hypothetical protein